MGIFAMLNPEAKNFDVNATAVFEEEKRGHFVTTEWKTPLPFSCPTSFGGTGLPSPEDLFLAAIATCTLATILQICERLHTRPESLSVATSSTVQFNESISDYEFSSIKCVINISGDKFLLERTCDLIPKYCLIGKNIKPQIVYDINITQA